MRHDVIAEIVEGVTLLPEHRCPRLRPWQQPTEAETEAAHSLLKEGSRLRRVVMAPWGEIHDWIHAEARRLAGAQ